MTQISIPMPKTQSPTRTIRVLHVRTVRGNGGGPEKTILRGYAYLRPLGVTAEALYLLDAATPCDSLLQRMRQCEMPIHTVYDKSALDPSGAAAFMRLVRKGNFDIVHTHDYKSNALARMFSSAGYRIVATAHGYNQTTAREGYYYWLEKMLLRRVDTVICPSKSLAELLSQAGVSRRRLCVLPNGIELDRWSFHPRRPRLREPLVTYVGRLSPEKNCQLLLYACARLAQQGLGLRLRLVGDGPEIAELQKLSDALGLAPQAEFLGHRDDIATLLAEADLLVNPSLTEAMPNSVLEALACGVPVIATDVGATNELIVDGQTGLLVPPGDLDALAQAIAQLARRPDMAQQLAMRGRAHVEQHFSFATRMAHVVAIYRGVLAAAGRSQ